MKINLLSGCLLAALATSAGFGWAQTSQPAGTQSAGDLPGEEPLPSVDTQLHVPMGPPAGTPSGKKVTQTRALPFDLALDAARAALDSCLADGYPMAVAVSDEHGYILVGLSADGAPVKGVYDAVRKNLAAITFKLPSSQLRTKLPADPALLAQVKPNMAVLPGSMPIMVGDRLVGAISTSGGTGYEEEKCDTAGIDKIKARLK